MSALGLALLDGAVGLATSGVQRQWSLNDYERRLRDQRLLAQEEREWNDFGSVISRASSAGVNPLHALGSGAVSGGNVTTDTPDIRDSDLRSFNVSAYLDNQIKQEQIKAAKIENEFRADRLDLENKYASAKIKTEESLQTLNMAEVKHKEALTSFTESQDRYQTALAEYQESANPQLLDNLRAEYYKMYAETTKFDNENAVFKEQFASNMRNLLAQTYQAVYQAKYYRSASEWAGYRAQTERMNATTAEKNVTRQEVADKAIADYNTAYMEWRKDMSSSEKWSNYTRSIEAVGNLLLSGFSMTRQPNQLQPLNVPGAPSIPYGGSNPFDTPYQ